MLRCSECHTHIFKLNQLSAYENSKCPKSITSFRLRKKIINGDVSRENLVWKLDLILLYNLMYDIHFIVFLSACDNLEYTINSTDLL